MEKGRACVCVRALICWALFRGPWFICATRGRFAGHLVPPVPAGPHVPTRAPRTFIDPFLRPASLARHPASPAQAQRPRLMEYAVAATLNLSSNVPSAGLHLDPRSYPVLADTRSTRRSQPNVFWRRGIPNKSILL